jgi:xylulokinase
MKYILGIDIGTQGIKGVIIDENLRPVVRSYVEHNYLQPKPSWYEHNAEEVWWGGFKKMVVQLMERSDFDAKNIAGVGFSGLAPCFLPVDKMGNTLRNAILYGIDTRAKKEIAQIYQKIGKEKVLQQNKQSITSQTVGPKMLWFKNNEPESFKRMAMFFTTTNYIAYKLTKNYVIDHSQASQHGPFYNYDSHSWDREMCDLFGVPFDIFPPIKNATDQAGNVTAHAAAETGLKEGTPVMLGTADGFAEVFSTGAFGKGEVTLIYGTTGLIIINTDKCPVLKELWIVPHPIDPIQYLAVGGTVATGALTKWFRDNFGEIEKIMHHRININAYDLLIRQAEEVEPGSSGLVVLPYFSGERTPINDPLARGMIFGLTSYHTRAHIYRSLLEAAAYSFNHHLEIFKKYKFDISKIIACGGGTKSRLWTQIVSDVIGYDQFVPGAPLGSEIGSAYMCAYSVGMINDLKTLKEIIDKQDTKKIEYHKDNHLLYEKYFNIYKKLYLNNKETMHEISNLGE